jgi:glucose/arabinose dehydrogenase
MRAQLVAEGLSFPTSLAFGPDGLVYVAESGLPFGGAKPGGRILRIEADGAATCLLEGLRHPVTGLSYRDGWFYVSEGGSPGRLSKVSPTGQWITLLDGLPGKGNYHTNMVAVGPDGKLYFSQGAMTNSGVVGLDAYEIVWLNELPHACDIPGYDVVLAGVNFETDNPLCGDGARIETGAFSHFGVTTYQGQQVRGRVPCTAAMLRCDADGSGLELVAWGLRNAFAIGFLGNGRLLAIDQGADDRGSRPIGNAPDMLFEVKEGRWYGWPDFIGGVSVVNTRFRAQRGPAPQFLLANHSDLPPPEQPLLAFPPHSAAAKFDVSPQSSGSWAGCIAVALFGDERPMTAPNGPRLGRCIARIDTTNWTLQPVECGTFKRPIDVRFHPTGDSLYVLDFGEFEFGTRAELAARAGTGALSRVEIDG